MVNVSAIARRHPFSMAEGRHRCTPRPCDACAMLDVYDSEQRRTFEEITALRLALGDMLDVEDEPCRFDHEGYCQAHRVSKPCVVAAAREVLER